MKPIQKSEPGVTFDMKGSTVEMSNSVSFSYQLAQAGQASGNISINGKSTDFSVSNVSNPLCDLLKGMVSLIFEPSHIWGEENSCWVDWYCDNIGFKWIFSTNDGNILDVKIIEYTDIFDTEKGSVKIHQQCNFLVFYQTIIQELDTFIKQIGLLNYEQKWQKDEFPLTYFLLLKKHLIEKGSWVPSSGNSNNLNDEINLLLA